MTGLSFLSPEHSSHSGWGFSPGFSTSFSIRPNSSSLSIQTLIKDLGSPVLSSRVFYSPTGEGLAADAGTLCARTIITMRRHTDIGFKIAFMVMNCLLLYHPQFAKKLKERSFPGLDSNLSKCICFWNRRKDTSTP